VAKNNSLESPNAKVQLFGFNFDNMTPSQAAERVIELCTSGTLGHYVVTPNLDHALILHRRPELQPVYGGASLVLADGQPIVWASRWFGRQLHGRVAGSDLVPQVFSRLRRPTTVFLLGAGPGVASRAAERIERDYSNVRVVGASSPPFGFEKNLEQNEEAVEQVARTEPEILIVGLGAPKQELWTFRERHRLKSAVILCAGATIDFLAGERARAPEWCQRYGLEWLYRTLEEPRRLGPRYAADAAVFPWLLVKQVLKDNGLIS
jgi:N-acetylglucosaminyldiphosphoundecaprenol N-acetyl-beta-D-mannosaminyltransferase